MAFIRAYKQDDFDAMANICRSTLPPSLAVSPDAVRLAPYIWTHQYTHLSPATCFVLDDGSGTAVGYCIGCPDIPSFCAAYPSYTRQVLDPSPDISRPQNLSAREPWTLPADGRINGRCLAQLAYNPHWLLLDETPAPYRATLHIDLLPQWQSQGWGRRLLERTAESLRAAGAEGVWIGVAGDNAKVVAFYEKLGFRVLEREGDTGATIFMVRDFY